MNENLFPSPGPSREGRGEPRGRLLAIAIAVDISVSIAVDITVAVALLIAEVAAQPPTLRQAHREGCEQLVPVKFAVEAAQRGADVIAVDLSPTLIDLAYQRLPQHLGQGSLEFRVGDMWDPELGHFDHIVAMDSLIHYDLDDAVRMLAGLAGIASRSLMFTFAPRTPILAAMHAVGRLFPRSDRAPAIEPVVEARLWHARFAPDTSAHGPTAAQQASLRIARKLYDEVVAALTDLVENEYAGLKDAMDTARVPYTPGRGLQR